MALAVWRPAWLTVAIDLTFVVFLIAIGLACAAKSERRGADIVAVVRRRLPDHAVSAESHARTYAFFTPWALIAVWRLNGRGSAGSAPIRMWPRLQARMQARVDRHFGAHTFWYSYTDVEILAHGRRTGPPATGRHTMPTIALFSAFRWQTAGRRRATDGRRRHCGQVRHQRGGVVAPYWYTRGVRCEIAEWFFRIANPQPTSKATRRSSIWRRTSALGRGNHVYDPRMAIHRRARVVQRAD